MQLVLGLEAVLATFVELWELDDTLFQSLTWSQVVLGLLAQVTVDPSPSTLEETFPGTCAGNIWVCGTGVHDARGAGHGGDFL